MEPFGGQDRTPCEIVAAGSPVSQLQSLARAGEVNGVIADDVAAAQGLGERRVSDLVARHTDERVLGFLGDVGVDVLALNVAVLAAARG